MELTSSDFQGNDLMNKLDGYVLFYADWCGHCNQLKPVWQQLVDMSKGYMVAKVDCTSDNKDLVQKLGIKGFPTICIFKLGKYQGQYQGDRTLESLTDYADRNFETYAQASDNKILPLKKKSHTMNLIIMILVALFVLMIIGYVIYASRE